MSGITWEDATAFRKTSQRLLEKENPAVGGSAIRMRVDLAPFTDVRVRRALHMATDLEAIRKSLNGGLGQIHTWPFVYSPTYAGLYLGLDDPDMPASVKELFTYNPDKAKQLLKEAGYPAGFKASALILSTDVDFYSILKDMWAKVGIDLTLDVKENAARTTIITNAIQPALMGTGSALSTYQITPGSGSPVATYYLSPDFTGISTTNAGMIVDPALDKAVSAIRVTVLTDERKAMSMMRDLMKYLLDQAYAIPKPSSPTYAFWWPWLKNYSGEDRIGYGSGNPFTWSPYVWIDDSLKKSMGY
jgi:peptide/nickel transport system substrate-binding protein